MVTLGKENYCRGAKAMLVENSTNCKDHLQGKVILLTGAGGGIGFEAAKAFAI
ncbi:hypothetical protein GCM10023142_20230 [Anaerocolumna aminovalerica]|jgi:NADP-dependent 3-hydroxy acid dehydrogenase YdfG|nr:hypothetical protein [Anaerocolumna aminovalerica]MBU5332287.1 hypothetical protein [Anaerocolumna aminovalerica]MDU6265381.1 hypothetical protein [Anaerocolumna aminovalerica]